jgi:hypothetical protein
MKNVLGYFIYNLELNKWKLDPHGGGPLWGSFSDAEQFYNAELAAAKMEAMMIRNPGVYTLYVMAAS